MTDDRQTNNEHYPDGSSREIFSMASGERENLYQSIIVNGILTDIEENFKRGNFSACVILIYCAIDAMAALAMPLGEKDVRSKDFKAWVAKYLRTEKNQSYQYDADDVWGARCGIIHRYAADSRDSDSGKCRILTYTTDGSDHKYNPKSNKKLIVISIPRFKNDFMNATLTFFNEALKDDELFRCIKSRICKLFCVRSIKQLRASKDQNKS
ncbi:MAG: hypothetical protein ABIJ26_05810 [Candidatus Margulisiibacteriota bacterium]